MTVLPFPGEPPMPFSERPSGPECACAHEREVLPCDWGWRCNECNLPVPKTTADPDG